MVRARARSRISALNSTLCMALGARGEAEESGQHARWDGICNVFRQVIAVKVAWMKLLAVVEGLEQPGFVPYFDAQFVGLVEFGACFAAGDHDTGLLGDRARDFGA